jgi:ABC-type multidrug transport system fused ATPase/permease subunit
MEAAKMAQAYDFILGLPQGFETVVGMGGIGLSGGQMQRIAIARALVRDPRILILDEATSALDTNTEMLIKTALDYAMQGRTSIVIAHRLSTIVNADRIYVLDKGRIAEAGRHYDLLARNGIYAELWRRQQAPEQPNILV